MSLYSLQANEHEIIVKMFILPKLIGRVTAILVKTGRIYFFQPDKVILKFGRGGERQV